MKATTPYARSIGGRHARAEATKLLRRIGCTDVTYQDEPTELILTFSRRGVRVSVHASATGWAAMHLKAWPHRAHMRIRREDYQKAALIQGRIAVSGVLRDWVRGQVAAVESGVMSFETAFQPYTLAVAA